MSYNSKYINTQNELLMKNLLEFYENKEHLQKMMSIIHGESNISLRIVDWFVTNYAKKSFVVYNTKNGQRFEVYNDYKLKLKAYSKRRFDPFQRWDRITIPYNDDHHLETTIGQLNFFKWAIENSILDYIHENYVAIEQDMNQRNSTAKHRSPHSDIANEDCAGGKTRKKREELSISATKCIKKETVKNIVTFS